MRKILLRLRGDLVEQIDRHVDKVNKEQPGLDANRSQVLRMLLEAGLASDCEYCARRGFCDCHINPKTP